MVVLDPESILPMRLATHKAPATLVQTTVVKNSDFLDEYWNGR